MQRKPEQNIREIARKQGLARRELDNTAGRVLVASGTAALWIIGQGILPMKLNQNGSYTFPDQNDQASNHLDYYLTYIAR